MNVLSLFSGIGLLDLGLAWAGMQTVGLCEIEPYCREVLAKHWPGVPCWSDVREVTGDAVRQRCGAVDLVAGGFPCQPVSVAGARKGHADDRWLWPEMLRVVRDVRPAWVLAENVPGLRTLGADTVLAGLDAAGYACWPLVVGADDVGAPHRRKRVWIVARLRLADSHGAGERDSSQPGWIERSSRTWEPQAPSPHAPDPTLLRGWPARPGEQQHEWEAPRLADGTSGEVRSPRQSREVTDQGQPQPGMGQPAHGRTGRLARRLRRAQLKALGNGVVPQVVAEVGRAILAAEERMRRAA